jgi:hypothetical protein
MTNSRSPILRLLGIVFKIALPLLIFGYGLEFFSLFGKISFRDEVQLFFFVGIVGSFLLTQYFVRTYGYLAVLIHELTHNLLSVLTLNKPMALQVDGSGNGAFYFAGRHNYLSVLAPYFFPTVAAFIFPIYFIIANSAANIYFGLLGLALGFSFSISIRQAGRHQSDLQVYGLFWSYLIIIFFQILLWGIFISFSQGRFDAIGSFLEAGVVRISTFVEFVLRPGGCAQLNRMIINGP